MSLMFAAKVDDPPEQVRDAAERLFATFDAVIDRGRSAGYFADTDSSRVKLLFAACMQGIATLVATRRITAQQGNTIVGDATCLMLHGTDDAARDGVDGRGPTTAV
ncbi:hypothetical protein [Mycobacterium sp.]|jgi:hypothetical protein|uniref:hypothetical protein n=1 Tax=Mycobacterium sp. TaxID=1785 RepID=UPI002611DA08|nr:hypothetical protein [Mycobacterium sp.]